MYQDFDLSIKSSTDAGIFEGLASTYGNLDHTGDIVRPGAFRKTLERSAELPILWCHSQSDAVGLGQLTDSAEGLRLKGQLDLDTQCGREAFSRVKKRIVRGLSIGYRVPEGGAEMKGDVRYLNQVDLFEVSLVPIPANDRARVTAVKAADLATVRDFEGFLREAGFSKSRAAAIASKGWRAAMETPDTDPDTELRAWLESQLSQV